MKVVEDAILKTNLNPIGILASPNTINSRLHANVFKHKTVLTLEPTGIQQTSRIIHNVIGGKNDLETPLEAQINALLQQGAQTVLLGCTELSVINQTRHFTHVIDPLEIVVDEIMKDTV